MTEPQRMASLPKRIADPNDGEVWCQAIVEIKAGYLTRSFICTRPVGHAGLHDTGITQGHRATWSQHP